MNGETFGLYMGLIYGIYYLNPYLLYRSGHVEKIR